ncbi:MAG: Sec1-like protein, partial [Olpidium bornovanus]
QLVSVCATLGEYPVIRYHRPDTPSTTARSNIAGRLASVFQNEMDAFCRLDPSFPPQPATPVPRATILILDRTLDVQAPLLHEFTYQAMVNDLLPIAENGTKYTYTFVGGNGEENVKDVVLDEEDPLWIQVRHTHIAECVKFSVHISMAQECMNLFEKHRIAATAAVEQDMATGEMADSSGPNKNIVADMSAPLATSERLTDSDDTCFADSSYDKVRLLSLYIISKEGVQDDDRRKLLDHARISAAESSAITNLTLLGVRLSKAPKIGKIKEKKKEKKPKRARADDVPYELSRYVPVLKTVLEDCAAGTLDANLFPFTRELQPEMDSSGHETDVDEKGNGQVGTASK